LQFQGLAPILHAMTWDTYLRRVEQLEDAISRIRLRLLPEQAPIADRAAEMAADDLRLFPIVAMDLCYPVASLLSRDKLEEAAALISDRCWVASTPLYG
jgi:hypothetical protein